MRVSAAQELEGAPVALGRLRHPLRRRQLLHLLRSLPEAVAERHGYRGVSLPGNRGVHVMPMLQTHAQQVF